MNKWKCEFEGVTAKWPTRKQETLKNIQLEPSLIKDYSMIPLMGQSGQGKSTLLYLLAALKWPHSGQITWTFPDGHTLSWTHKGLISKKAAWLRRQRFGFAFQDHTLTAHLTVLENIAYPLVLKGEKWSKALQKAKEQLVEVLLPDEKIEDFTESFPAQLSGGQQQRVALAQAMIHEPWVLFADEPTGQLDYHTRQQVMTVLKNWIAAKTEYERRLIWETHHHTDDLDMMNIDTLLFIGDGKCEKYDRSQLESWMNKEGA